MKINLQLFSIVLFLLLGANGMYGQNQFDLESRTGFELTKKFGERFSVDFENQIRFDRVSTDFDLVLSQISIAYKFKKKYRIAYGLRYVFKYDDRGSNSGIRHYLRYNWDFSRKNTYDRLSFTYRYRFQRRNQLGIDETQGDHRGIDHRLKMKTDYNIKDWKWDPSFSVEGFWHFEQGAYNGFNKTRYTLGTSHKYGKKGTLGLSLAMERESRVWKPQIDFLAMISWSKKI